MSNRYRSETTIVLGGSQWLLRPSFDCIASVESQLAIPSIMGLMLRMGDPKTVSLREMAVLVRAGVIGSGMPPKQVPELSWWGEQIQAAGFTKVMPILFTWLRDAIASDEELAEAAAQAAADHQEVVLKAGE